MAQGDNVVVGINGLEADVERRIFWRCQMNRGYRRVVYQYGGGKVNRVDLYPDHFRCSCTRKRDAAVDYPHTRGVRTAVPGLWRVGEAAVRVDNESAMNGCDVRGRHNLQWCAFRIMVLRSEDLPRSSRVLQRGKADVVQ